MLDDKRRPSDLALEIDRDTQRSWENHHRLYLACAKLKIFPNTLNQMNILGVIFISNLMTSFKPQSYVAYNKRAVVARESIKIPIVRDMNSRFQLANFETASTLIHHPDLIEENIRNKIF